MSLTKELVVAFIIALAAGASLAQKQVAKLCRVSSSNGVIITDISTDGLVAWSNKLTGTMARVEVADAKLIDDWRTYTHVNSTGQTGTVTLWHNNTPEGFAFCPAGTFVMGSPTNEVGRDTDEMPHQVTLTRGFFMQKTEVTNLQMAEVLNWVLHQGKVSVSSSTVRNVEGDQQELLDLDDSDCQVSWTGSELEVDAGKDDYPCLEVTWYGAQAFCNYLSDMEGLTRAVDFSDWTVSTVVSGYCLPTEAQWEYACRAGTTTAFYTGVITYPGYDPVDPNLDAAGWYWGNATNPENPMFGGKGTHPVGGKLPNDWDLYDMHGNVWEWCADWYGSYPTAVTDPIGPLSGTNRVVRGGGLYIDAKNCRSSSRLWYPMAGSPDDIGFRPIRSAVPDETEDDSVRFHVDDRDYADLANAVDAN